MTCQKCGDVGLVHVSNSEEKLDSLAYCTCDGDKLHVWKLPVINKKIELAFKVTRCPLHWFLPDNERGSVARGHFMASMAGIRDRWIKRVRAAETMWNQWGLVFDDRPKHWTENY